MAPPAGARLPPPPVSLSASPPSPLSHVASQPNHPPRSRQKPRGPCNRSLQTKDTSAKIGKLRVKGRMTETRVSVAGRRNFSKTDKCSFIATYRKQLITYGRWCGISSVGCLWTNSAVLCKLPIWPSLCISLTLAALRSHMLRAEGPGAARGQGPTSAAQQKTPWSHSPQPPQTFSVSGPVKRRSLLGRAASQTPPSTPPNFHVARQTKNTARL